MSLLVAQQIHQFYGEHRRSRCPLEIEPGECALCVTGAGKSTLIKIRESNLPIKGVILINFVMGRVHVVEQAGVVAVHQNRSFFPI